MLIAEQGLKFDPITTCERGRYYNSKSEFETGLGFYALLPVWVLDLPHFRYQVCEFDQFLRCVATGPHNP